MSVIALKCPEIRMTVVGQTEARIAAWNQEDLRVIAVYELDLPL
jgi:UDPglucose 6-dehydrogenase